MVKKKILSIIFSLFIFLAVIAPCAIGVFATEYYFPDVINAYYGGLNFGNPFTLYHFPANFAYQFSNTTTNISFRLGFPSYIPSGTYYFGIDLTFNFSFSPSIFYLGQSVNLASDYSSWSVSDKLCTLSSASDTSTTYHISCSFSPSAFNTICFTLPSVSMQTNYAFSLNNFYLSTEPESLPSDDDQFTSAIASGFYYSFTPSVSSDYFPLKTFEDYPDPTDQGFSIAPSNSLKAYFGADIDYSDILTYHTIVQGSASFYCVNTNGFTGLDLLPSFQVLLSNVADPLASNYTSIDVSTLGLSRTPITGAWSYPVNNFTSRYTVSFYLILDGEALSPTYLSNYHYIDIVFNSSVQRSTTIFFTPQDFTLSYFHRASSSSPIPDNPYPDTVDTDENNYTQMTNAELKFLQSQLPEEQFIEIDNQINTFTLRQTDFSKQLFDDIYSNLSYSGTDFQFMLPTATIPFPDAYHPLTLWSQQEIPFKYYIDNLPHVYRVIVGWLVIAGGAIAVSFYVLHEVRSLFIGNIVPSYK